MIKIKLLFLGIILLLATGCSDKKEKKTVSVTKIKEYNNPKEINISEQNSSNLTKISTMLESATILKSIKGETHGIVLDEDRFIINDIKAPVLLVSFFSTWCPPCRGQLPYFEDLKKKYRKDLFIAAILVNDEANATTLKTFYKKYHMDYFVSNDIENEYVSAKVAESLKIDANFILPLTVLYKNGHYYTHYEGMVPVEMIDHDIRMALDNK